MTYLEAVKEQLEQYIPRRRLDSLLNAITWLISGAAFGYVLNWRR